MLGKIILSTAYFPTVQYISKFLFPDEIYIEKYENYIKQTYRNRCNILTSNGIQSLIIPVIKKSGIKNIITDLEIDYTVDWQSNHFKTIEAAYKSSPFFEFYIDSFMKFFQKKYVYLFDFNFEILNTLLEEINIEKKINFTNEYIPSYDNDFRTKINPKEKYKIEDKTFNQINYTQVFEINKNFTEELSIIDVLFNEGPQTELYLKKCINT
jgi:hypothetical protein